MSAWPVSVPQGPPSLTGVSEWPLRGRGSHGDREGSWVVATLGQRAALNPPRLSLSTPALGSGGPQRAHLGRWGGAGGLPAGLSRIRLAGDWGWGCPPPLSSEGISLPRDPPRHLLWLLPRALPPLPIFPSLSPHQPPHPDINECEEDGIECGPSQMCFNTRGSYQCVDTPCPATYRQGSSPG